MLLVLGFFSVGGDLVSYRVLSTFVFKDLLFHLLDVVLLLLNFVFHLGGVYSFSFCFIVFLQLLEFLIS